MKSRLILIPILVFAIVGTACKKSVKAHLEVTDIRVENLLNPVGIDVENPHFSWKLISSDQNIVQAACQVIVKDGNKVVWDSKKVLQDKSYDFKYNGEPLTQNTLYSLNVSVWDNRGVKATGSGEFHIGLLNQDQWGAKWIGNADKLVRTPLLRKQFNLKKNIKSAYLYVTGVGYFESFINGAKTGSDVLSPSPSQYQYRVYYSVYNVADMLSPGDNTLGLILGEAQAASSLAKPERFYNRARPYPGPFDAPRGIAKLMIVYDDDTEESIVTDESWKSGEGALSYNHFYGGEDYDARKEMDWLNPGFDDGSWDNAIERSMDVILSAERMEPMKVVDVIEPVKMIKSGDSIVLYDLGQLIGGWWRITVQGEPGLTLSVIGAETLNNQKFPKTLEEGDVISTIYAHGLGGYYERDAITNYTLKGEGTEVYEPRFFYSGFRYVQVKMDKPEMLKSIKLVGCTTHNQLDQLGSFDCSDSVLTQLHKNSAWTIKAIFQGAPMSNSNSEKYGWTGDAHLFAEPTNMIFYAQNFWRKWLADIRDAQLYYKTGNVISTIPNFRRDTKTISATWGAAYPLITWYNYLFYDDVSVIHDNYEGIKEWANHLKSHYPGGLVKGVWADHVPPGVDKDGNQIQRGMSSESSELIASVYYYHTLQLLEKMAVLIDRDEDVEEFITTSQLVKNVVNNKYFDKSLGAYVVPPAPYGFHAEQAANLIPLQYNVVPEGFEKAVMDYVLTDIAKHNNHLTTGIAGTKAMVDVLPELGYSELFYTVATQETYPGWGYWIKNGATTHWQHWSGDPDHCHAMFGSISNFLVANIAGIRIPSVDEGTIGYKHIHFAPIALNKLNYAKASVPSKFGNITCGWKRVNAALEISLDIPVGTTAMFSLPDGFTKSAEHKVLKSQGGDYYILFGSGNYSFEIK